MTISTGEFIGQLLLTSFCVFAIWKTMQPFMIFESLGDVLDNLLPEFAKKPVFSCPVCMGPWYGILFWGLVLNDSFNVSPLDVLAFVLCIIGLNTIIMSLFPKDEVKFKIDHDDDELNEDFGETFEDFKRNF